MRSIRSRPPVDDRTTQARIRDATIALIATEGVNALSARRVADSAGVSPGSVIHHFGSMDGLRTACDEHVAALIRRRKMQAMSAGPGLDLMSMFKDPETPAVAGYLAAVLAEDSPALAAMVDELVDDAADYLQQGVDSGMLKPSADPRSRAVVLTVWGLSALVLHRHIERLLGVDLTGPDVESSGDLVRYVRPVFELFSGGIYTEAFAASLSKANGDISAERKE